jgi:hypothetical protein
VTDNLRPVEHDEFTSTSVRDAVQGSPSRSQSIELLSGVTSELRVGFDSDVTNYLLPPVSNHEPTSKNSDEPAAGADGSDSHPTQKQS